MLMNDIVKRRVSFLLDAAKSETTKDQAITYVMRVLSNHATIGKDALSKPIKKINRLVTKNAERMLINKGIDFYCKETINEHPKPIKQIWEWLKNNSNDLTLEDIWKEFCENPMITVTKDEDDYMRRKGLSSKGTLKERYLDLGIEIIELDKSPYDISKLLNSKTQ